MMFVFFSVSCCSVLLFDEYMFGLMWYVLLFVLRIGYMFNDLGCVKLSSVCFVRFLILCGWLCVLRYVGFVSMCIWLLLICWLCSVEFFNWLIWIVMLVCCFSRLVMFLLLFSFSLIFGKCLW